MRAPGAIPATAIPRSAPSSIAIEEVAPTP